MNLHDGTLATAPDSAQLLWKEPRLHLLGDFHVPRGAPLTLDSLGDLLSKTIGRFRGF